jgi:alkylation response protein AidB-like acyl-CoA dehydrogenase
VAEFSLDLNEDQLQIQQWVHDFAQNVVRPVAAEWDEREETPWPVIEEAAKVGLYSIDFFADAAIFFHSNFHSGVRNIGFAIGN